MSTLQLVSTLVGTVVSSYVPLQDFALKSLLGQTITQCMSQSSSIGAFFWERCGLVSKEQEVFLSSENAVFHKMEEYIVNKFSSDFKSAGLATKRGNITFELYCSSSLRLPPVWKDTYQAHAVSIEPRTTRNAASGGNHAAKRGDSSGDSSESSVVSLRISSPTAAVQELRDYVEAVCNFKKVKTNTIKVYQAKVTRRKKRGRTEGEGDNERASWEELNIKTNKTIGNTIVSDVVQRELFDDVEWFMRNENFYNEKGLPYKRGFVLAGPPGTGKTSVVKAMANHYSLDIFLLDLELITNNNLLYELLSEATYLANNKPHILSLEDADRCKMFRQSSREPWRGDPEQETVSIGSFLGMIDGIVETHGRILFLTVNDLAPLKSVPQNALLRPGRIDKIVEFDYCSLDQIKKIVSHFYNLTEEQRDDAAKLFSESCPLADGGSSPTECGRISPAELIKVMQADDVAHDAQRGVHAVSEFLKKQVSNNNNMKEKKDDDDETMGGVRGMFRRTRRGARNNTRVPTAKVLERRLDAMKRKQQRVLQSLDFVSKYRQEVEVVQNTLQRVEKQEQLEKKRHTRSETKKIKLVALSSPAPSVVP